MAKKRKRRSSRHNWIAANGKYLGLAVVAFVSLGAAVFALTQPVQPPPATAAAIEALKATPTPTAEPIRLAVVGDSITEANSPDFNNGRIGDISWLTPVLGDSITFAGGWADGGAPTETIAANVTPYDADVLVIAAGTNDSFISFERTTAALDAIVAKAEVPRVIVSAIPPNNTRPNLPTAFNAALQQLASERGWEFVDAAASLRDGEQYIDGYSLDGVHPTKDAARILGEGIRAAILG